MPIIYKTILSIILLGFVYTTMAIAPQYSAEKKYSKTINTSDQPNILLESKKGNVTFQAWDNARVELEITIKSEADSQADADKGLEGAKVEVTGNEDQVKIQTIYLDEKENKSFWSTVKFWSDNLKLSVDMVIKVPRNSYYDLSHTYGDLVLPDLREAKIEVKYGSITANDVSEKLSLDLGYGNANLNNINACNAVIKYSDLNTEDLIVGQLEVSYSKISAKKIDQLVLDTRYSKVYIDEINQLKLDGRFDKIEVGIAHQVDIETKYTSLSIDRLLSQAKIVNSYQSVKINELGPDFSDVNIENKYGNCNIKVAEDSNTKFKCVAKFGKINYPTFVNIDENEEIEKVKTVVGTIGQGQSNISIVNNFGNIDLSH
ncbi:hypothetical protein GCM10025777_01850 [Membranihabitans marinus]